MCDEVWLSVLRMKFRKPTILKSNIFTNKCFPWDKVYTLYFCETMNIVNVIDIIASSSSPLVYYEPIYWPAASSWLANSIG